MNRHERRKAAKKKQRPKIENDPDDTAPDEGAYLFRVEVLWLRGAEALQHLEAIIKFMAALAQPLPPQCFICERKLGFTLGQTPWWVGKLSRVAVANSAADPRRYRKALANPPETEKPGIVELVALCESCCPADVDPNDMFKKRFLEDQAKVGCWLASDSVAARFSTKAGSA